MGPERRRLPPPPEPVPGRVAVVGICASGKTTLVEALRRLGYDARECSQEHSYVPDMWRRLSRPEVLIYLHASPEMARERRDDVPSDVLLERQYSRLAHAREHCDVYIDTDPLAVPEVLEAALGPLRRRLGDARR